MLKIFFITLFLAVGAFAQPNVQVLIDGHRYYCSQDPNGTDTEVCVKAAKKFTQQFNACIETNQEPGYCFQSSYGKVSTSDKQCAEVQDICNKSCKDANQNPGYCYQTCY